MSHFSVLVIGDEIEKQLQPYHEYECTGTRDQYVVEVDKTDEVLADWEGEKKREGGTEYRDLMEFAKDYHGISNEGDTDYSCVRYIDGDPDKPRFICFTNPNAKWDYWRVGGRWGGLLKLKPLGKGALPEKHWDSPKNLGNKSANGYTDQARKGDVDFESMRRIAEEKAAKRYDPVAELLGIDPETGVLDGHIPWDEVREERFPGDINAARKFYHEQPAVKALDKYAKEVLEDSFFTFSNSVESFAVPRADYLKAARDSAVSTFAVVKDGKWFEQGKMGFWACVTGEKDAETWNSIFDSLVDPLDDDTMLTVVDCHI